MSSDNLSAFKVDVAADVLNDLKQRLYRTRWSYQIEGTGWDSGTDINYLRELVGYWQNEYDWRALDRDASGRSLRSDGRACIARRGSSRMVQIVSHVGAVKIRTPWPDPLPTFCLSR